MKRVLALGVLALGMGGCAGLVSDKEKSEKQAELTAAWRVEATAPEPTPVPPEVVKTIGQKVAAWAADEEIKRKAAALTTGVAVASKAATGDYIGAALGVIGLIGAFLGAKG